MKPIPLSPFLKGLIASNQILAQPKGSIARDSNLIYTERGALVTCDGTEILNWFDGAIQGPDAPVGPTPPPPLTPPCPPVVIQSTQAQSGGANMVAQVTIPNVTPGNTLVAMVAFFISVPSASTLSVSDDKGDAFSNFFGSTNFQRIYACYGARNVVGGNTTISFNFNINGTWVLQAVEVSPTNGESSSITTAFTGTAIGSAFMPSPALLLLWGGSQLGGLSTSDIGVTSLQTSTQLKMNSSSAPTSGTYTTTWTGLSGDTVAGIAGLLC